MIPFGYAVDLYEDDAWTGYMRTLTGRPFENSAMQVPCQNLDVYDMEDKVSSMKVYKTD